MMEGFGMHGWWGMGWWWIIGFILLVFIVWLVVTNQRKNRGGTGEKSSLDILKDRYARGEITKEEFDQRKKDLV